MDLQELYLMFKENNFQIQKKNQIPTIIVKIMIVMKIRKKIKKKIVILFIFN